MKFTRGDGLSNVHAGDHSTFGGRDTMTKAAICKPLLHVIALLTAVMLLSDLSAATAAVLLTDRETRQPSAIRAVEPGRKDSPGRLPAG
jgi:hypothetical protein